MFLAHNIRRHMKPISPTAGKVHFEHLVKVLSTCLLLIKVPLLLL